jgi:hypothetical protein
LRHRRRGQGLKGFEACAKEPVDGLLEALLRNPSTPHNHKRLAVRIAHFDGWLVAVGLSFSHFHVLSNSRNSISLRQTQSDTLIYTFKLEFRDSDKFRWSLFTSQRDTRYWSCQSFQKEPFLYLSYATQALTFLIFLFNLRSTPTAHTL